MAVRSGKVECTGGFASRVVGRSFLVKLDKLEVADIVVMLAAWNRHVRLVVVRVREIMLQFGESILLEMQ